jgi:hypothetical protein
VKVPTLIRIASTILQRRASVLGVYFGGREDQAAAEQQFFSSLRMPNGTAKTSWDRRLDDLNALVAPLLPSDRPIAVMDVAVGSGISSLEWVDQLRSGGRQARLVAGDLYAWGWLTTWGSKCAVLYLDGGEPLTLEFHGRAVNLQSDRLIARSLRRGVAALLKFQAGGVPAPLLQPPQKGRRIHRRIPLVSPRLVGRGGLEVVDDDLAQPGRFSDCFDVVRAANILNRAYFDEATLSVFVANLIERVRQGGLLAICRTESDGTNRATVFRRTQDSMTVQGRLGGGSEVEDLVLASGSRWQS